MSAIDQLQKGDWIKGAEGTHWVVTNPDDYHNYVRLMAVDDAELKIKTEQFVKRLNNGEFEPTTPPEDDQ
jgi:hypothetical protein